LETEGLKLEFADDAIEELAAYAERINTESENIGARRLYTILERVVQDLSFDAPDKSGQNIVIDREYVRQHLEDVVEDRDLSRYIL
jgi:ATP-dependent HslUV protease ATP-binding subunit HslU